MAFDHEGRIEPPLSGPTLPLVAGFHGWLRETLFLKCAGLTEEQLRWSPVPSGTCLLGILKHSLYVERWWIAAVIGQRDVDFVWTDEDPDADWRIEPDDTLASISDLFHAEAARSANVLAGVEWDDMRLRPGRDDPPRSVGWVMTHMIEEVARHCGHADLIRELIDGNVGE